MKQCVTTFNVHPSSSLRILWKLFLGLTLLTPWSFAQNATMSISDIQFHADILRERDRDLIDAINDPALTAVTKEYGFTVINTNTLPFRSAVTKAHVTPWSSYWFPKKDPRLFDDRKAANAKDFKNLSTLTKLDLLQKHLKSPITQSASEFERKSFDPNAQTWEGLCDAWALASIFLTEPKRSVTYYLRRHDRDAITFDITEIKGLLLKTLEAVPTENFKYYGQKFTGQDKGWIYPDLFPEQFHRLLEVQLFEKRQPFIVDIDQGVEIWNYPAYKANFTMTAIPNEPNAVFVRTWVYFADSLKSYDPNYTGTKEVIREYNYVLQGDRNANGDLIVNLGYWAKGPSGVNSRNDHPDFVVIPPSREQLQRQSWNPGIDIKVIDEISAKSI
jgi:hypothetical protein